MTKKIDASEISEALSNTRYLDHMNCGRAYGRVKVALREAPDFIDVVRAKIHARAPEGTQWIPADSLPGDLHHLTDHYVILDLGLTVLAEIRDAEDIQEFAFGFAHQYFWVGSDAHSSYEQWHDTFWEPLLKFLEKHCADVLTLSVGSWTDPGFVQGLIQEHLDSQGILLANPYLFPIQAREFSNAGNVYFVAGTWDRLYGEVQLFETIKSCAAEPHLVPFKIRFETAKQPKAGPISDDIWNLICGCKALVVDVRTDSFNVGYEVGIAHALGKKTILLGDKEHIPDLKAGLPFDLKDIRCIHYGLDDRDALLQELSVMIAETLASEEFWPMTGIGLKFA